MTEQELEEARKFLTSWQEESLRIPYDNGTGELAETGLQLLAEIHRLRELTAKQELVTNVFDPFGLFR